VDSNKNLKKLFEDLGVKTYEVTDLGNPSFTDTSLRKTKHPLAELILKYREAYKLANTYYRGFLYHADINDIIHTNMKQSGTETGRFSFSQPNLQNVSGDLNVRKCFVARDNYSFVEMDYKAFEYRMLCEYAKETELSKRIMTGEDVHTVTAQMVGVERHVAKSLNFACIFGAGPGRISEMLGISIDEARKFRQKYFQALPKIESFIRTCSDVAKQRGFIFNWLGRRSYIDSDFSYKATNSLIQGSCADIVKVAMNQCADYLKYSKSRMLIQVHDSILFEIHDDEKRVVPKLKEIMENAYQGKNIKMEVDVSDFGKNWAEIS
jgi:DNA polymerase-1